MYKFPKKRILGYRPDIIDINKLDDNKENKREDTESKAPTLLILALKIKLVYVVNFIDSSLLTIEFHILHPRARH